MAKVLRIHKGAADTIGNWDSSVQIGTNAIDSIPDPVGATDKHEITSIPSPFARMDLVKRAFKIVAEGSLDGKTAYHKLVSDCLDVGQIFFNIEKYRDIVEIIVWDKKNDLALLNSSESSEHRRLANTYKTYLDQDADEYNFNEMDCIYLLNYVDSSAKGYMNIIGATSPASLFFTSANDLEYVGEKIKFGDDFPFDSDYKPLYKRDFEYIKYWWSLKHSRKDFSKVFPEVDLYLQNSFRYLTDQQREDLRNSVDTGYYTSNYDDIPVVATAQDYVTILGEKLRRKRTITKIKSGFEMKTSNYLKSNKIPLVLPVDRYTESTHYVISSWDKDTKVPYYNPVPINERTLPDDGSKYPYVTIGDFLEDTIIKVPYKFNSAVFFDGNDTASDEKYSFLLPLRKTFFDYFSTNDLIHGVSGEKLFEIVRLQGKAVKVILRIPIVDTSARYIKYEKIYYQDAEPNAIANKGAIEEQRFTLGLYPNIKYPDGIDPYFRVAFLDRNSVDNPNTAFSLSFYNKTNDEVGVDDIVRRNRNSDNSRYDVSYIDSITYALNKDFDYLSLTNENNSRLRGIIVPKFVTRNGGIKFRFAIDFGTTNTHIEYSKDGGASKAFDITEQDMQMHRLHDIADDFEIDAVFSSDFIPSTIGGDSMYSYPMRTVISEGANTNWDKSVVTLANVNIPYTYEKSNSLRYNIIHTDLKWSTKEEDKKRASKYIESILSMLRTKVLLNNGDLSKTEIVWFYPASMTQSRFNKFKSEWDNSFSTLFGAPKEQIIAQSESIAPYYFHKAKKGATSTVVSVDIGGGTTDVLIVDKGEPKFLTSFRFAANSIFGDGYSYDSDSNGFVEKYSDVIKNLLESNQLIGLRNVLNSVAEMKTSTDIIAFMFSLAKNKEVKKKNIEINFGKMLADDNQGKYAIILFYVAIMFHIAKLMNAKKIPMPRHITFSGNGSKVLNILSTNDTTLVNLTKIIFEKIYGENYSIDGLDIIRPENSKESTCKGGIILSPFKSQDYSEIKNMKTILIGNNDKQFADLDLTYKNIDDVIVNDVVKVVEDFIDFAFDLNKSFSFYDNFDVDRSIINNVRNLCKRDIKTYLENGISIKKDAIALDGADEYLEETLFFYPLVGIINAIVRNVYKM